MITPQPIIQQSKAIATPASVAPQSVKPAAPVKQAVAQPTAISAPAIETSVFINPKTLRTVAKLTNAETGEVIGFIPPKIVSATYSAAAANASTGLVSSELS